MEYLPCENPMKWALCCISIQQFLFPKGGIAAFFMPVGDVDNGQKPYYNDTRMQRELLREAERKDTSTFTPDLDNANVGIDRMNFREMRCISLFLLRTDRPKPELFTETEYWQR